jgi:tRNA-specific 2-thiouridylase
MSVRKKVLVAMSGGVDSSVAASLLVEQGHEVIGVFMRMGSHDQPVEACTTDSSKVELAILGDKPEKHRGCCSAVDAADARAVAGRLGIPFYALNFERDFEKLIDYFADEYAASRTPNPCVMCNSWLKFGKLVAYADSVGAEFIATGHYARMDMKGNQPLLRKARHIEKDQSYFLFGVHPRVLARTLFPIGELTKAQVREHARNLGLAVHDKAESQDICFVQDRDYSAVVRARRPEAFIPGEIRHTDGRLLGTHDGLPNFTIGQRRGLNVAVGSPLYVSELNPETSTVTVGTRDDVLDSELSASHVRWLTPAPDGPVRAMARIRYNHEPAIATITPEADEQVRISFDDPQWAITPGQAAVFYDENDTVLGGGWID